MEDLTAYCEKKFIKSISEVIKNKRIEKGYDVDFVAKRIGVSPGTYRNLESGQRLPAPMQLEAICNLFLETNSNKLLDTAFDVLGDFLTEKEKNGELKDSKEVSKSYREVSKMIFRYKEKLRKEKDSLCDDIQKKGIELIELMEKYNTPIKVLSDRDKEKLHNILVSVIDLRVKDVMEQEGIFN